MKITKKLIETWFEALGRFLIKWRFMATILILAVSMGLTAQISKMEMDTSTEGFMYKNDPDLIAYNEFREQFGNDEIILIAVQAPDIFSSQTLLKLKNMHKDLETEVPYLDEITSLLNARNTRGNGDELSVGDLLQNWPEKEYDLQEVRSLAMANSNYRNMLLSADGRLTTVLIKTGMPAATSQTDIFGGFTETSTTEETPALFRLSSDQIMEVVTAVNTVVERYQSPDFRLATAGSLVVDDTKAKIIGHDAPLFMKLTFLIVAICLLALFRRFWGMLLPLLTVFLSLFSTLGLMAVSGTTFKLPTTILPALLVAVGVGYSVHILTIFYLAIDSGRSREDAIVHSLGHSGLPVVMTCLTTVAGLGSFAWSEMVPVADVGIFASIGVTLAMIYSLIFLPAMLAILPSKARKTGKLSDGFDKAVSALGDFSATHAKGILGVAVIIAAVAAWGTSELKFSMNVLKWFPEEMQVRQDTEFIDRELKGSLSLEMIINTGRANGLYDRELLNRLDRLTAAIQADYTEPSPEGFFVGKITSLVDILKEINQALNENNTDHYSIPDNAALIPQEFLLFENSGSDDLEDFVDSQFSKARITIKVPYIDAAAYGIFLHDVKKRFREELGPEINVASTGIVAIFNNVLADTITTLAESYITAIIIITVLMVLLVGEWRLGLASMVPNLLPILCCLGFMGFAGIPMDNANIMIGSIVLGIVVDDTIHFMNTFRRYHADGGQCLPALEATFMTTGRAMLFTSVILFLSFYIYIFATMEQYINFGLLTGSTIMVALVANYILAPALISVIVGNDNHAAAATEFEEEKKCA